MAPKTTWNFSRKVQPPFETPSKFGVPWADDSDAGLVESHSPSDVLAYTTNNLNGIAMRVEDGIPSPPQQYTVISKSIPLQDEEVSLPQTNADILSLDLDALLQATRDIVKQHLVPAKLSPAGLLVPTFSKSSRASKNGSLFLDMFLAELRIQVYKLLLVNSILGSPDGIDKIWATVLKSSMDWFL